MTKTGIDELLKAIKTVEHLRDTTEKHEKAINEITLRLDRIESQLAEIVRAIQGP